MEQDEFEDHLSLALDMKNGRNPFHDSGDATYVVRKHV